VSPFAATAIANGLSRPSHPGHTLQANVIRRTLGGASFFVQYPKEGNPLMAKINRVLVGESLVGDGNEVAHIDLIIGPRGSAAETAFVHALANNKDGFTTLLAVIAPNLPCKPNTIMFNKVTIKDARQAVQMFGPAQYGVAKAVQDSVAEGVIPANEADDVFILVGVFIHWEAADDAKIQDYNYRAVKESIARAVAGKPTAAEATAQRNSVAHPFGAKT
jgi:5,6,7,8-tetrahydromethanopterin hydro-lyase